MGTSSWEERSNNSEIPHIFMSPSPQPKSATEPTASSSSQNHAPVFPIWRRDPVSNSVPAAPPRLLPLDASSVELRSRSPSPSESELPRPIPRSRNNRSSRAPQLWQTPDSESLGVKEPHSFVDRYDSDILGSTNNIDPGMHLLQCF